MPNKKEDQLVEPMLKKMLFAVITRCNASQEDLRHHLTEHLEYMIELEKQGKLFASGPFPEEGKAVGDGLTLFQVNSFEEAKTLIDNEPLTRKGLRTYELRQWEFREGRIDVSLEASTSSFKL